MFFFLLTCPTVSTGSVQSVQLAIMETQSNKVIKNVQYSIKHIITTAKVYKTIQALQILEVDVRPKTTLAGV